MSTTQTNPQPEGKIRTGAAYIRVSTDDQLEYSPESQLEEIRKFCASHQILLPAEYIFIEEEGRSGRRSTNRQAFQTMISTAKEKPRPFDVIVLWKFSRFARNQDESTFYKSMLRKKLGIDVISVSEPLMEGMYGRLMEMIIEWQDEFYSVNLSGEVRRSMLSRARKGMYNGKMPLGYTKAPKQNPVINEEEAAIVRTIFDLYASGKDINAITRYLNQAGLQTKSGKRFDQEGVIYILENPFYIGKIRYNMRVSNTSKKLKNQEEWIIANSFHEPIISMEQWDKVQARRALSKQAASKYAHPVSHTKHWLSGLVKCSVCGKSLSHKEGYPILRKGYTYIAGAGFQCLGYMKGLHSGSQYISEKKLVQYVISSLQRVLDLQEPFSFDLVRSSEPDQKLNLKLYEKELSGLDRKAVRIREAYMNEVDSLEDYKRNKEMLQKRREELLSMIEALSSAASVPPEDYQDQFLSRVRSVLDIIQSDAPSELKASSLREIVSRIVFHKETETLEFHYFLML